MSLHDVGTIAAYAIALVFVVYMIRSSRKLDKRYDDPEVRRKQEENTERSIAAAEKQAKALVDLAKAVDNAADALERISRQ
jgi:hypothetical protein